MNPMIDGWVQSVGSLCWAQEQGERLLESWLKQGRIAREEAQDLAQRLAEQTKANQKELQSFVHHTVALSLESLQRSHRSQLQEMQQRLDDLQAAVERLAPARS